MGDVRLLLLLLLLVVVVVRRVSFCGVRVVGELDVRRSLGAHEERHERNVRRDVRRGHHPLLRDDGIEHLRLDDAAVERGRFASPEPERHRRRADPRRPDPARPAGRLRVERSLHPHARARDDRQRGARQAPVAEHQHGAGSPPVVASGGASAAAPAPRVAAAVEISRRLQRDASVQSRRRLAPPALPSVARVPQDDGHRRVAGTREGSRERRPGLLEGDRLVHGVVLGRVSEGGGRFREGRESEPGRVRVARREVVHAPREDPAAEPLDAVPVRESGPGSGLSPFLPSAPPRPRRRVRVRPGPGAVGAADYNAADVRVGAGQRREHLSAVDDDALTPSGHLPDRRGGPLVPRTVRRRPSVAPSVALPLAPIVAVC